MMNEARATDHDLLIHLHDYLMGSIDVCDYGIPCSNISQGGGSPNTRGTLGQASALLGCSCFPLVVLFVVVKSTVVVAILCIQL
jgi:hypothetical protein